MRLFKNSKRSKSKSFRLIMGSLVLILGLLAFSFWLGWSVRGIAANLNQSSPSYDNLLNQDLPEDLDYRSLESVYDIIRHDYDGSLNQSQILIQLKKGLVKATDDPYSEYYSSKEGQLLFSKLQGSFVGIGIYVGQRDDKIMVISPIKGSPAEKAGLLPGDFILEVDGVHTHGLSIDEVITRIKGQQGTEVVLEIHRLDQNQARDFSVTIRREQIKAPGVIAEIKEDICILTIFQFITGDNNTADLARQQAEDCLEQKAKGVILDLRSNPGGDLEITPQVAGLWLSSDQVVVSLKRKSGESEDLKAKGQPILKDLPLVVLINQGSASAAEILAAALDDYQVATLVGQTTFGKTSVQTVSVLSNQEVLKLTTNHWYTPFGRHLKNGLQPDVQINDDLETIDDEQLNHALRIIKGKIDN